jgi:hypothetical protein
VSSRFFVWIELAGTDYVLQDVRLSSSEEFTAVMPAKQIPGAYDLRLLDPHGRWATLEAALEVYDSILCADNDGDGEPDCTDGCVDRDGDGLGSGALGNVDCIDPATDTDDDSDRYCADVDSDGCDDCFFGGFAPAGDGLDSDGDGQCEPVLRDHRVRVAALGASDLVAVPPVIPAVDPARSVLFFNLTHESIPPASGQVSGQLAGDGASVTFERVAAAASADVPVAWTVVELEQVRVLRGMTALVTGGAVGDPIETTLPEAVDPLRSFVLFSLRLDGTDYDRNDWARAELTGATTLTFYRSGDDPAPFAEWQVIELATGSGARVQQGQANMVPGVGSVEPALPVAAPRDRSFLVFSHRSIGANDPPAVADYVLRGRLLTDSQLAFERYGTQLEVEIAWSVVTWDGMRTQHGEVALVAGETEGRIPLAYAVDPSAAVSFLPNMLREGQAMLATSDRVGEAWFTSEFENQGATLVVTRGSALGGVEVAWTVVEFQ